MNFIQKMKRRLSPEPEYILHPEKAPEHKPMTTQIPDDYKVEIVKDYDDEGREIGFHHEPHLSSIVNANDYDRLRWHAAAVNAHHPELRVQVVEGGSWTNGVRDPGGQYCITFYRSGLSSMDFISAWTTISALDMGAEAIKDYYKDKIDDPAG